MDNDTFLRTFTCTNSSAMIKPSITVTTTIKAPIDKVWACWTEPEHIVHWNSASEDWHSPSASNDLQAGGSFSYRMEAKDGSVGFDFGGVYEQVDRHAYISYAMSDGRRVRIEFSSDDTHTTTITETFETEDVHPLDMQEAGWQAILDNFKRYTESQNA